MNSFFHCFLHYFCFGAKQEITNQEENTFEDARQGTQV